MIKFATYLNTSSRKLLVRLLGAYKLALDLHTICSITDAQGVIIYVNQKFCQISKYSENELLGQKHKIVNSGHHPPHFFRELWQTITKGDIWEGEVKCKAKDGTYFWLHSIIIPLKDDDGTIVQYFSLRFSIDERKQAENERHRRIKELEDMLFMISHNVRQPVTNLVGLVNLLESKENSEEELATILAYIKESAHALDDFTRELTSYINGLDMKLINDMRDYPLS